MYLKKQKNLMEKWFKNVYQMENVIGIEMARYLK